MDFANFNIKAFENTSTSIAASQMRNALNKRADTVEEPEKKKVRQIDFTDHGGKLTSD